MKTSIDLNADIGEGCEHDGALLDLVSSANIACAAHAGSVEATRSAIAAAKLKQVAIGAHPGFPDRENFGRRVMTSDVNQIAAWLEQQLQLFAELAASEAALISHVKPHGALYHLAEQDAAVALTIVETTSRLLPNARITGIANGELVRKAEQRGVQTNAEAFIDRRYLNAHTLAARGKPGALLDSTESAVEQALAIAQKKPLAIADGELIQLQANTLCVHGDNPQALAVASAVERALLQNGIHIKANA